MAKDENKTRTEEIRLASLVSTIKRLLVSALGVVTIVAFVTYSIFYWRMEAQESENRALQTQSSLNAFASQVLSQIAILGSSPSFIEYLRSGEESRKIREESFLAEVAHFSVPGVQGVRIVDRDSTVLFEVGSVESNRLEVDLCYLDDRLDPFFGQCIGHLLLSFDATRLTQQIIRIHPALQPCSGCEPMSLFADTITSKVKFRSDISLPLRTNGTRVHAIWFVVSLAMLLLAFVFFSTWVDRQISEVVRNRVMAPVQGLFEGLIKGTLKSLEKPHYVELSTLHESLLAAEENNRKLEAIRNEKERLQVIAETAQALAHDVRKPFSLLKMALNVLGEAKTESEMRDVRKLCEDEVHAAMQSVDSMIRDVLEFGSTANIRPEVVHLKALVDATASSVLRLNKDTMVDLQVEVCRDSYAFVDSQKLGRVLANILENAVQATGDNGQVRVSSESVSTSSGKFVKVSVENKGSHIPETELETVFEPFFTKRKKGGTGLGLAIAKKIILAHGGRIWCESCPTSGVRFQFTVPCLADSDRA